MTKKIIIGLTGLATSGKGIVSARLLARHGFVVTRFADPIKRMLSAGLGLTNEQLDGFSKQEPLRQFGGCTSRHLMQTLGTDWGRRSIHSDIWVNAWRMTLPDADRIVVDDLRFPNEALALRDLGGAIWRVNRPGVMAMEHVSERAMREIAFDISIENTSTIAALQIAADKAVENYLAANS